MPRLYIVDTNVVISGVLSAERGTPPSLILTAMVDGHMAFLLSAELLAEYRRVLLRPAIVARHGLDARQVDSLIATLATTGYLRQPSADAADGEADPAPDCPAGDEHVRRLLAHEPWSVLVSGDIELVRSLRGWRQTLSPADAVTELALG